MVETTETIKYEKEEKVVVITLNRPDRMNALNTETIEALRNAWAEFESDPDLRVAILTGSGKAFCAGMDMEEAGRGIRADLNACIPNYGIEVTKPIIGAINGWSIGAGMGLATACDIRVMSQEAKFLFPEVKVGFAAGGLDFLKFMSNAVIMEYLLTGEPLDAKRAYDVGLANRVVPPDAVMDEAMTFADKIKDNAPLTMKMIKMCYVHEALTVKTRWLLTEARYIRPQLESEDFKEGIRAFKEKRKPVFKNK